VKPAFGIVSFLLAAAVAFLPAIADENPVALLKGLGPWTHPIATGNPEAQKFFDQGLNLAYGFNRYEALRSFRKAAELDPHAAMAYWGIALAQGPYFNMDGDPSFDLKGACAAVDSGLKIADAPERERAYLRAAATWCPEFHSKAYSDAMRELSRAYPDDPDALTIYAESLLIPSRWHWYSADGTPAEGVREGERALEEVLRRWPQHPGANHYYIHAVESSPSPERAVASAQRLMGIMPAAGHIVHMPGHIWLVLGEWQTAVEVNERAVEVDREYFRKTNVTGGSYEPYYLHNLDFILYARTMQGHRAEALHAIDELGNAVAPMARSMPEMADAFSAVPMLTLARYREWDRILKLPEPGATLKSSRLVRHYARCLAFVAKRDRKSAEAEFAAFEKSREGIPEDASWGQNKARDVDTLASQVLVARLASSPSEAVSHWQQAVEMQDRFTYDEPPAWYYPVRESLGAALLRAGEPAKAESVFREGVRRTPHDGWMLFGLLESLKSQKKQQDAYWVKRELDAAWAKSDVVLRLQDF